MNIYHISYTPKFVGERMATLSFKGCNFECTGCLRKRNEYDPYAEEKRYIEWTLENILKELEALQPQRIYLGGYEPTLDLDLLMIIKTISNLNAHIVLMTNGSTIDRAYARALNDAGVNEVIVSVKAFDSEKHRKYTKRSNELVLNAINHLAEIALGDADFRLQIETILLPGVNDPADIEELALFISHIDPSISLFIEPWIPVEGVPFTEPTKKDLIEAVSRAMKHLYVVSYHPLHSEIQAIRQTPRKAKFIEILPQPQQ